MSKKTLEKAAEDYAVQYLTEDKEEIDSVNIKQAFKEGAKWQAERMYSQEEVSVKLYECLGYFAYQNNIVINGNDVDEWFEQHKKK